MQMRPSAYDRNESQAERDDRNLMELLQELRVAGLGVQVLFGFLLAQPFTNSFAKLSHAQRGLFIADPILAAVAAGSAGGSGRLSPPRVPAAPEGAAGHSG